MSYWAEYYFLMKIHSKFQLERTETQLAFSFPYSALQSEVEVLTAWGIGVHKAVVRIGICPEGCEQRQGLLSSDREKGKGVAAGQAVMQWWRPGYL